MKVNKKNSIVIVFLVILIIAADIYCDNNVLQVSHYKVTSNKIPESFKNLKILQLSDLHSKSFGSANCRLIKKINDEKPDIVVMTGDMINTKDTDYEVFINLAKEMCKSYKTYYIVGNHEQNLSDDKLKNLKNELKSIGVKVLDNEKVTITKDIGSINLYGLWFGLKYYKDINKKYNQNVYFGTEQIKTILGDLDDNSYNILLTHNPLYFDTYSAWGADLTLSGHIHGGMIRIPFIGGLFSPEKEFFPKYNAGKYMINGKELIVNRGLGNGNFGVRIFNRPEITVITLSKY